MVRRQETANLSEVMDSLSPISNLLNDEQIEELKESITIRKYKKKEVMYSEGDVPQYFHCLISGKVKVYKEGVGGRMQIVRIIRPVEFFGYRAYLANENYMTSAAAFESCTLCLIPMRLVEKWTKSNLQLAYYFIKLFAVELGRSDKRIVNLTQKHIRGRLAEAILFLKDTYGTEEDNITIAARISREDLANLSNMTTSNAIRTLSAFCSEGILAVDGRKMQVLDEDLLKKISRIG